MTEFGINNHDRITMLSIISGGGKYVKKDKLGKQDRIDIAKKRVIHSASLTPTATTQGLINAINDFQRLCDSCANEKEMQTLISETIKRRCSIEVVQVISEKMDNNMEANLPTLGVLSCNAFSADVVKMYDGINAIIKCIEHTWVVAFTTVYTNENGNFNWKMFKNDLADIIKEKTIEAKFAAMQSAAE